MMRCSPHLCLCLLLLVCACVCGAKGLSQRPFPSSNSNSNSSESHSSSDSSHSDSDSSESKGESESEAVLSLAEVAGSLRLDAEGVTVSGLSSGGFMAVQLHVAFSALVHGAAVFAGGPFYCADNNAVTAQRQCMEVLGAGPNVAELVRFSGRKDALGQIDSLSNLRDDKVFLFRGAEDTVVDLRVVTSLQEYYATYVDASGLSMDLDVPAEHCLPTLDYGEECEVLASPYLGRCDVDGAGRAFATLFSDLQPRVAEANPARLLNFDQTPYFSGSRTSLDPQGFLYVPSQCQDGSTICRLHISFHGCLQGRSFVGNQYALDGGFNEWADSNNIVVLYPNALADSTIGNPNGCWDWWGYTNVNYGLNDGVQMVFTKSLIDVLLGI